MTIFEEDFFFLKLKKKTFKIELSNFNTSKYRYLLSETMSIYRNRYFPFFFFIPLALSPSPKYVRTDTVG